MVTLTFPSRNRSALTAARNTSAVDGTTINFSPFCWAVRPPGQDLRNQARKSRVSPTHEMKMGFLLGSSSTVKQVLFTWALGVVPSALSLRSPDMSLDMSLLLVSDETHWDAKERLPRPIHPCTLHLPGRPELPSADSS